MEIPCSAKTSTSPAASGASGPTTTRSTWFSTAARRHSVEVAGRDVPAGGDLADSGIAGSAVQLVYGGAAAECPGENMLSAATPDYENIHSGAHVMEGGLPTPW